MDDKQFEDLRQKGELWRRAIVAGLVCGFIFAACNAPFDWTALYKVGLPVFLAVFLLFEGINEGRRQERRERSQR